MQVRGRVQDWIGWALLGLLIVAIVVAVLAGGRGDSPPPPSSADGSAAPREIPQPPTNAPVVGMYVDSEVAASGDVTVEHWIRAKEPITEIRLTAADPDGLPGGVIARKVVVVGDDMVLARRSEVGTKQQTVRLKQPATYLYVTYRLTGGVESGGTVVGRVLARSVALDVDYDRESGPVSRFIGGVGEVLNVACLLRDDREQAPEPCGRAVDRGWLVELTGKDRDSRLLAQLAMD